jgi:hypothetical protein
VEDGLSVIDGVTALTAGVVVWLELVVVAVVVVLVCEVVVAVVVEVRMELV